MSPALKGRWRWISDLHLEFEPENDWLPGTSYTVTFDKTVFVEGINLSCYHYDFLQEANISNLKPAQHYGLALALGGGELTMLELSRLYAALANIGLLQPIESLKSKNKNTQYNRKIVQQEVTIKRILSAEASFLTLDMLKDNSAPRSIKLKHAYTQRNAVAWKTGISWAFGDAWAIAVSGPYVVAVWVGNFDGQGNDAFVGRTAAGPLLFSLLAGVLSNSQWQVEDTLPDYKLNIKQVPICAKTGDLFEKHCPVSVDSWFIPGISPIKNTNVYRAIPIDNRAGLRACWRDAETTSMKTFEFWPSDFLQVFNQAGVSLKTPPSYLKDCDIDVKSYFGQSPVIDSPQSTVTYMIQDHVKETQQIAFLATVDVEQVFWFVNEKYVGSAKHAEDLFWQPTRDDRPVKLFVFYKFNSVFD